MRALLALLCAPRAARGGPRPRCGKIHIHHTLGCFNDSDWQAPATGPVLPQYQPAVRDNLTWEACADACYEAGLTVVGAEDGYRCWCGNETDLSTPAASARSRPKAECAATPCRGDPSEKECGGPGRLVAVAYSCDAPLPPPPGPPVPPAPMRAHSLMYWVTAGTSSAAPDTPAVWAERLANVAAHRENVTGVSPCMYSIDARGGLGTQPAHYPTLVKYMPQYAALGLDIVPLIAGPPNVAGLAALLRDPGPFITDAVALAVKSKYTGYNFDNELRGKTTDASWAFLKSYGEPWAAFLDRFADALHGAGKTLSVDIAGCCGWVDAGHPKAPAGHCADAFATHEFVGTTCPMYKASRLDIVYGMSTYSGRINGPDYPDLPDNNTYNGPGIIRAVANATQTGVGAEKYAFGFKGGWPYCSNYTEPATCLFDETARQTIRYVRDTLGVKHASQWVNEPRSQAAWDAYGYFLHGE